MSSPNCLNYLLLLLCAIIWKSSECGGAVWTKEDEARALRYGQGRISSHATFDLSQDAESQIHQEGRPQGRTHLDSQFDANSLDNSPQIHQFEGRSQEIFHIDPLETQFDINSEKSVSSNREIIHISQLLDEAEMSEGLSEAQEETEMSESSEGLGCISCRFLAKKAENFAKVKRTHKSKYKGRCLSCGLLDPPNHDPGHSEVENRPLSPRFVAATSNLKVGNKPVHSSAQSDGRYRPVNPRFFPAQLSDQVDIQIPNRPVNPRFVNAQLNAQAETKVPNRPVNHKTIRSDNSEHHLGQGERIQNGNVGLDLPHYQVTQQQNPKLEDEEKTKTSFEDGIIPSSVSPRLIIGGLTKHEDM